MFTVPICLLNIISIIGVVDPYYNNVVSLLHFNGTNSSTSFIDETGKTYTAANSAAISTTQSKFGGSSAYFNGSSWISAAYNSAFNLPVDFTIETHVYFTSLSGTQMIVARQKDTGGGMALQLRTYENQIQFVMRGTASGAVTTVSSSSTVSTNTWYHIAAVRYGTTVTLFIDGISVGSVSCDYNLSDGSHGILIGAADGNNPGSGNWLNGYVDESRITNNVARYTSNFNPPTSKFQDKLQYYYGVQSKFMTNIADMTSKVWTAHGNASVSSGALQLDGTGDYIDTPYHADCHFTTGQDVTIRFKSKVSSFSSDRRVLLTTRRDVSGINNWAIYANSSNGVEFKIWVGGGASSILLDASWASSFTFGIEFELSLERKGMIWRLYINGSQVGSPFTQTSNYTVNTSSLLSIGTEFNTDNSSDTSRDLNGTLRSLQIIKGVALSDGKSNTTYLTYTDTFDSNTISNYTEYSDSSGNWTISNGYLSASTGSQSILTPSDASFTNGEISCIISQADDGGMVLRLLDNNNYYLVTIRDNSASSPSVRNQLYLYKRGGGNYSIIGSANIPLFTRNTPTKMTFYAKGDNLIVKVKDIIYINVTDSTFTSSGKCGVRMHSGQHQYESFTYPIS